MPALWPLVTTKKARRWRIQPHASPQECFSNYPEGTASSFCLIPNLLQTNTSVKYRKYELLDVALNIFKHLLSISVLILLWASNSSWFGFGPLTAYTLSSIIQGARKDSGGAHKTAYWLSFARCGLISLPCSSNTILPSTMFLCHLWPPTSYGILNCFLHAQFIH